MAVAAPADGGFELAGKSDALVMRVTSGETGELEATDSKVTRLRLGLEGAWRGLKAGGSDLSSGVEIGVRHDGGDAETGFGLDLGGGLAWSHPASGVSVQLSGRGLMTHMSRGFRDWGFAASVDWKPEPDSDRGPSLTLSQTVGGSATGGMDALLGQRHLGGFEDDPGSESGADGGDEFADRRMELRLGYGVSMLEDRYTLTPELGVGLSNGHREYTLGWRLNAAQGGRDSLELRLEASRGETAGDNADPEHRIGFRLATRW